MEQFPFPTRVSNSSIENFKACEWQWYWSNLKRIEPKPRSVHLHAGSAFASALETARREFWINNVEPDLAVARGLRTLWLAYGDFECPEDSQKSWLGMSHAYLHYFNRWPLESDYITPYLFGDKHAIEFNFAVPLEIRHPTTGDPILYTGRVDMFAQFQDSLWVEDDKTTKGIGPKWADQWALRGQFIGYTWAGRAYDYPVKGTIVRGISILKHDNKDAEAIKPYPNYLIDRWHESTLLTVQRMIAVWEQGNFAYDFSNGCGSYAGCDFIRLCESKDPDHWMGLYQEREKR